MIATGFRIVTFALLIVITLLTVLPIKLRPSTILRADIDRGMAFAALGFMLVFSFPSNRILVALLCIAGTGLSELLQHLSPSRHAEISHALAKAVGASLGVVCGIAIRAIMSS